MQTQKKKHLASNVAAESAPHPRHVANRRNKTKQNSNQNAKKLAQRHRAIQYGLKDNDLIMTSHHKMDWSGEKNKNTGRSETSQTIKGLS